MEPSQLIAELRAASRVRRCHTLPWIGDYTVGQHSFDMLTLLLALHPDPSRQLMIAVIAHDLAERVVGDVPVTAKWASAELAMALERAERRALDALGAPFSDHALSFEEHSWLKALDSIELMLSAYDQLALGNRNAQLVIDNLREHFGRTTLPSPAAEFVAAQGWLKDEEAA